MHSALQSHKPLCAFSYLFIFIKKQQHNNNIMNRNFCCGHRVSQMCVLSFTRCRGRKLSDERRETTPLDVLNEKVLGRILFAHRTPVCKHTHLYATHSKTLSANLALRVYNCNQMDRYWSIWLHLYTLRVTNG